MPTHSTIKRYTLIIEKIGRNQYPSFEIIRDYLYDHGFEISARTIQRDIEQIRFEFGVEIKYDRTRNGYYIDTETGINTDTFLRFLEIVNTAELLTESLRESKDSLHYISFDSHGSLRGIDNLKPLLFAIKNKRRVTFLHENFETGKQKTYSVKPYLLKEYQNRWYLVGIIEGSKEYRTFGIDRILNLEVLKVTFKTETKINPVELFENTIGISYSGNELEEVILSFTPLQAKYVLSLPLHQSQEIISKNKNEVQIRLKIIPNFEFIQRILMLGENVKVLHPTWLVNEIKKSLANAIKNYQ